MKTLTVPALAALPPASTTRPVVPLLPRRRISGRVAIWSFLAGLCLITPLGFLLHAILPPASAHEVLAVQRRLLETVFQPGWVILAAVIIAPLFEEIIFRGCLLSLLRRHTPTWVAVLGSSAVFGAIHLPRGPVNAIAAGVAGGLFAWLTLRTRSLLPGMIAHASLNFCGLFLVMPAFGLTQSILDAAPHSAPSLFGLVPLWWTLLSVALGSASLVILHRSTRLPSARA